jgi:hypothetical protein
VSVGGEWMADGIIAIRCFFVKRFFVKFTKKHAVKSSNQVEYW